MSRNAKGARDPVLRRYQFPVFADLSWALRTLHGETFTVLFPRQAGKNQVAGELLQALMRLNARDGGAAISASPTFAPQGVIALERTRAAFERTDRMVYAAATRFDGATLATGRATARFLSASPMAHVAGHTASIVLFADEAQEIDHEWFERQFRPMAASTAANTVLFGTPWNGRTLLDEAVARNRQRDAAGARGVDSFHHQVPWQDVAQSVEHYGEFVLKERERLGPKSVFFKSQYELETVESEGSFFSAAAVAALHGTHERQRQPRPGERYVAGLDLAGDGEKADASVMTIARVCPGGRCEVVEHLAWRGSPAGVVESAVAEAARHWQLEWLTVDRTGLGYGLADHLARALTSTHVEPFQFTVQSKSELGSKLLYAAGKGALTLYENDGSAAALACWREIHNCTRTYHPDGRLEWGAARGHDDYVVSLALALHAANAAGEPRFATGRRRTG